MSRPVFPMWVFGLVALTIALVAFGLAQGKPGAGAAFVIAASTMWAAYVASKARKAARL
ncbi:hypothetical protein [Sphingomonas sp.]|uniref:hypothetical protein n=1 Tax=Sphingomonas sp. TaxID=28214 RepID=UPI0025EE029C|nr:hypothetical protein [Sphingomonas sp.]